MNIIVAVDQNWAIGYKNNLLCHLPSDLKHFKETTLNKTVIMGRKTLESLPNGQPLNNRRNIVLSNTLTRNHDMTVVNSMSELKQAICQTDSEDLFVIGGEKVYRLLLPFCHFAYITKIDRAFKADTFFPNLDFDINWIKDCVLDSLSENNMTARIIKYKNNNPNSL
jgi:dihydrofolate reductase